MVVRTIEISCVEVWRELSNYIDGELDPELRRRMEEHFKGCEHCSAILDGTRNVVRLVGDGRAFELPTGFSDRLKARLQRKINEQ
jgi:anti-sigma factor RsiW